MSTSSNRLAKSTFQRNDQRVRFLRKELALSFTFALLAKTKYEVGNRESAERSLANAEKVYSEVRPFLADPVQFKHLRAEQKVELTAEIDRLRKSLDSLKSSG
jgi:hypothetical protein